MVSISDQFQSEYLSSTKSRERYESSPQFSVDNQQEAAREEAAPIMEEEAHSVANSQKSIFDEAVEFGKNVFLGVGKGVEETGQSLGVLKDNAFNIPETDEIGDQIARGLGQFSTLFIPGGAAIRIGLKMANLFQKSKKLSKAGELVAAGAAGAVSDAFGFDPKDPNAANLAFAVGVISKDSQVGAAVNEFLAQNDEDSATVARTKNAVTGLLLGAMVDQLVRGVGYVAKGFKGRELKEAAEELATETTEMLDTIRKGGDPKEIQEQIGKVLPTKEEGLIQTQKRADKDYKRKFESLTKDGEIPEDVMDILNLLAAGKKVPDQDLDKILSVNLLKSGESHNMMNTIQYISSRIKVKEITKPEIATQDFDTVIGDMIDDFMVTTSEGKVDILSQIAQATEGVRDAIPFVGTIKALMAVQTRQLAKLSTHFANNPTKANHDSLLEGWQIENTLLFNGSGLSKAASDLLRSHKKTNRAIDDGDVIKKELQKRAITPDPEVMIRSSAGNSKLDRLDKIAINAIREEAFISGKIRGRKRKFKVDTTGKTDVEVREEFLRKASAAELLEIDKMNINQMRTRLAAMDRSFGAKTFRVWSEVYVNGLLSSMKTIAEVNPMGTASTIVTSVFERAFAGLKTGIRGKGDIGYQEAIILSWNYFSGAIPGLKIFAKALWHGPTDPNFKLDFMNLRDQAISKEAWNLGGPLGKFVDMVGTAINMPGRLLLTTDEAFKSVINHAEQRALAYRKARSQIGNDGTDVSRAAIASRTQNIIDNIFEHEDIILQAREAANINTFTNILPDRLVKDSFGKEKLVPGLAKSIKEFIDQRDPTGISRIFIPFFNTPANIFQYALDRTPLINRISNSLKADLRSTNLGVKELAEARMGTAWMIWGSMMTLAYQGNFTGAPPRDPNLRKTMEAQWGGNRHWFSVNFGDGWRTYNKVDPYGLILTSSAILANMAKGMTNLAGQYVRGDASDAIEEKYGEVIMAGVVGVAEMLKERSYIQGIVELMDIFSTDGRDMNRTARRAAQFIDLRTSFFSSLRRNVKRGKFPDKPYRLQDKETEGDTLMERNFSAISNEISQTFQEANDAVMYGWGNRFAMKDLAGNVTQYPGVNQDLDITTNMVNSLLNPSPKLRRSSSPLINKLAELESKTPQPSSINKVNGVILTDEEKSFLIDAWTDRNKVLDKTVISKSFLKLPQGTQLFLIENMIGENKQKATQEAMLKFDRLAQAAIDFKVHQLQSKTAETRPQGFQSLLNQGQ